MSIRSLKLCYQGSIRRFALESVNLSEDGSVSLAELKEVVRNTFQELEHQDFALTYKDEDDDIITVLKDGKIFIFFAY